MKKFTPHLILLLLLALPFISVKSASFPQELFFKALDSYEKGQYEEAKNFYHKILKVTPNGATYYNLGNTYYRLGEKAKAIFAFRKALSYLPMNGDLHYNLQYLRSGTLDKIQDERGMTLDKISMKIPLTLPRLFLLISFTLGLFSVLAIVELFRKNEWLKWSKNALFLLFIFCLPMVAIKYFDHRPFGVVRASETQIFSGIGKDNVILFKLHEGSEFWISDQRGNEWFQITLNDGKKGWIKEKDVVTDGSFHL